MEGGAANHHGVAATSAPNISVKTSRYPHGTNHCCDEYQLLSDRCDGKQKMMLMECFIQKTTQSVSSGKDGIHVGRLCDETNALEKGCNHIIIVCEN
jgi:hypothetical protein